MKNWLKLSGVLAMLSFGSAFALAEQANKPKISLSEKTVDVGDIKEGETITHAFLLSNQGNQTLEIKDVKPG
jgi:hypothetical protein